MSLTGYFLRLYDQLVWTGGQDLAVYIEKPIKRFCIKNQDTFELHFSSSVHHLSIIYISIELSPYVMTPMASAVPGQCRLRFLGRSAALNGAVRNGTSRGGRTAHVPFANYNDDNPYLPMDYKVQQARDLINMVGPRSRSPEYSFRQAAQTIDSLQRLGIDHHFPQEIGWLLGLCYEHMITDNNIATTDQYGAGDDSSFSMYEVATAFRLLRQHGYNVCPQVFDRFQDAMGRFKLPPGDDVIGLLALHEASFLGIHGEDDIVLVEAGEFARKHIEARLPTLKSATAKRAATYALDNPYHLILPSFSTKFYLENSLKGTCCTGGKMSIIAPVLYELAKLDFNSQQSMHVEQLRDFSQWNIHEIDSLPGYMQICFSALYKTTNEIAEEIHQEHGWNPIVMLRKAWAALCDAFLVEAKWFSLDRLPPAEEYLRNGVISSGVPLVLLHLLSFLGEEAKIDSSTHFHSSMPALIASTATILRLWDDLGSAKDEKQQGYDGSYVNCYRNETGNSVPVEEAREQVRHLIKEEWKKLNAACISPNSFSTAFTSGSLNAARMVQLMYSYDEDQRLVSVEQHFGYLRPQNFDPRKH